MIGMKAPKRGRRQFASLRPLFVSGEFLLRILPRAFSESLLSASRNSDSRLARATRYMALRRVARECGELVDVHGNCFLFAPRELSLGSRISVHPFCYIDATGGLSIGSDVSIAHGVSILTTEHSFADLAIPIRDQALVNRSTSIGSDVWIGAGAKILAGVDIGDGSVVAAGAVVRSNVAPGVIVAGVPSRQIRDRRDPRRKRAEIDPLLPGGL